MHASLTDEDERRELCYWLGELKTAYARAWADVVRTSEQLGLVATVTGEQQLLQLGAAADPSRSCDCPRDMPAPRGLADRGDGLR